MPLRAGGTTGELPLDEGPYLEDLFELIGAQPRERWPALVEQHCGADRSLAAELGALLAAHGSAGPEVGLRAGERLGRYMLERLLGTGASAEVWQAFDSRLQRSVALKVFRAARRDGVREVLQEARATADVVSDYVIRVQDVSDSDSAAPWYIDMELCAEYAGIRGGLEVGRPMSETEPRSREEVIRWLMEAALGIQAAHEQNVFHRDIKPDNVLIRPMSRRAQVTDFGLAVPGLEPGAGRAAAGDRTVTLTREKGRLRIAGTPIYMAPEQARGLPALNPADPDDRRTLVGLDIYGLGASLYTALTGRPPYAASPGSPDPVLDVLSQVRLGPPPSVRARSQRFPIPRRLARVVERAMARDPAERYPSAAELADDLRRVLMHLPTSQDARRPLLAAGLALRRSWRSISAGLAVAMMLVATTTSAWVISGARLEVEQARVSAAEARSRSLEAQAEAREARAEAEAARALTARALEDKEAAHLARARSEAEARSAEGAAARANTALERLQVRAEALEEQLAEAREQSEALGDALEAERAALGTARDKLLLEVAAHEQTASLLSEALVEQAGLERQLARERDARRAAEVRAADELARRKAAEVALAGERAAREAAERHLSEQQAAQAPGAGPAPGAAQRPEPAAAELPGAAGDPAE